MGKFTKFMETLGYESQETREKRVREEKLQALRVEIKRNQEWLNNVNSGLESNSGGTSYHMRRGDDNSVAVKIQKSIETQRKELSELEKEAFVK